MKIILSRKGFDSGYGGCASPIFPDKSMASFPIPYKGATHTMGELACGDKNLGKVVEHLTMRRGEERRLCGTTNIHLDPYLKPTNQKLISDWRPAFGQDDAAQTHLSNQGVGKGDLFLFFGWFREVKDCKVKNCEGTVWQFKRKARDLHVIFGWLQVGEIYHIGSNPDNAPDPYPIWLEDHPHIRDAKSNINLYPSNNTIYTAQEKLNIDNMTLALPGGGVFEKFTEKRQLTEPGHSGRSTWKFPAWFKSNTNPPRPPITYHPNTELDSQNDRVIFQSASIGQEFVFDSKQLPQTNDWLKGLFD